MERKQPGFGDELRQAESDLIPDANNRIIDPDPELDPQPNDMENPFESLQTAVAFWPGDWSLNGRLAWIYRITNGWEHAIHDVAVRHGWTPADVRRLKRLRKQFKRAAGEWELPLDGQS